MKPEALPRMPPASSATPRQEGLRFCSLPSEPTCTAQPPAGRYGIRVNRVDTGIAGHTREPSSRVGVPTGIGGAKKRLAVRRGIGVCVLGEYETSSG